MAGILAFLIYTFELLAIVTLISLAIYFIYRTQILHKTKTIEDEEAEYAAIKAMSDKIEIAESVSESITSFVNSLSEPLSVAFEGFASSDRKLLKKANKLAKKVDKSSQRIITDLISGLESTEESVKENYSYGRIIGAVHEVSSKIKNVAELCGDHVENNHKPPSADQIQDINQMIETFEPHARFVSTLFDDGREPDGEKLVKNHDDFIVFLKKLDKNQISRIKKKSDPSRSSLLFINVISDLDNISANLVRLVSAWDNTFRK